MKLEELQQLRDSVKQQFDNISNATWIAGQLDQLRGKYEILNQVISNLEQEQANAEERATTEPKAVSNDNKGKQAVSRSSKR